MQCTGFQPRAVASDDHISGKQEEHAETSHQQTQHDGHSNVQHTASSSHSNLQLCQKMGRVGWGGGGGGRAR